MKRLQASSSSRVVLPVSIGGSTQPNASRRTQRLKRLQRTRKSSQNYQTLALGGFSRRRLCRQIRRIWPHAPHGAPRQLPINACQRWPLLYRHTNLVSAIKRHGVTDA
jgi:hypothetical protein